jgi:predicted nucleic-acid-binding Zn-ribbon protein
MKDGQCPKCGSTEVYASQVNHPQKHIRVQSPYLSGSAAPVKYLCTECGYLEYYVEDENFLALVRHKWQRVQDNQAHT